MPFLQGKKKILNVERSYNEVEEEVIYALKRTGLEALITK